MDGSIEHETKLTGILSTGALAEAEMEPAEDADPTTGLPMKGRKYGTVLGPSGLYAMHHQVYLPMPMSSLDLGSRSTEAVGM